MSGDVKKLAMAYGTFLAFVMLTNLVVRPILQKTNVPLLSKAV